MNNIFCDQNYKRYTVWGIFRIYRVYKDKNRERSPDNFDNLIRQYYINDLIYALDDCELKLYADDTVIYHSDVDHSLASRKLQSRPANILSTFPGTDVYKYGTFTLNMVHFLVFR